MEFELIQRRAIWQWTCVDFQPKWRTRKDRASSTEELFLIFPKIEISVNTTRCRLSCSVCLFRKKKKKHTHTKNKNFSVDKMEGVCCPGSMLTIQCQIYRFIIIFSTSVHICIRCITLLAVIWLFVYAVLLLSRTQGWIVISSV